MIVNLTPHALTIITDSGQVEIPSSGLARVGMDPDVNCGSISVGGVEIPIYRTGSSGKVTGLATPKSGTTYVVSRQVYDACPNRDDLVITYQAVREDGGRIVGCRAFAKPSRTGDAPLALAIAQEVWHH